MCPLHTRICWSVIELFTEDEERIGARMRISSGQLEVSLRYGAIPEEVDDELKIVLHASATADAVPLNGLRHPGEDGTSGWYVWGGEQDVPLDGKTYHMMHQIHLEEEFPKILDYLALRPGWRFLIAPGYEDVWYDESLLDLSK